MDPNPAPVAHLKSKPTAQEHWYHKSYLWLITNIEFTFDADSCPMSPNVSYYYDCKLQGLLANVGFTLPTTLDSDNSIPCLELMLICKWLYITRVVGAKYIVRVKMICRWCIIFFSMPWVAEMIWVQHLNSRFLFTKLLDQRRILV